MEQLVIRKGGTEDVPSLFQLIKELAIYEKASKELINTPERLLEDLNNHLYDFYVAEKDKKIIGIALTYYRYSTWKGKCLYLEDFYIVPEYRMKGVGKKMFAVLIEEAKNDGCYSINWQVLNWNERAIKFYENIGAEISTEWYNGRLIIDKFQ